MEYTGQLRGFPEEIVEKMLERQVEQGNKRCINVFEIYKTELCHGGGFSWSKTPEGADFWRRVICNYDFALFFDKYPKKSESKYPKIMLVSDDNKYWRKRVVFMEKCGKYLAWANVETLEDANNELNVMSWYYANDIPTCKEPKIVELTIQDISDGKGVGVDPNLIRIKK